MAMHRNLILLALVATAACGSQATPVRTDNPPTGAAPLPGDDHTGTTREINLSGGDKHEKLVMAKDPPRTLIAGDDTKCTISEKRFQRVRIGDSYVCNWR
jgi:hypothetical protein